MGPGIDSKGQLYLNRSAKGVHASEYHLEVDITMLHCKAFLCEATHWLTVLHYYDILLACTPRRLLLCTGPSPWPMSMDLQGP
jgi:predicted RNA polymerase sigma factor